VKRADTLIVGLGNPILTDDGVGPAVARGVHERLGDANVHLREAAVGGIALVEMIAGYSRVVIIDAIKTDGGQVGECYLVDLETSRPTCRTGLVHEVGLLEGLELGRRAGLTMPESLQVYAIEVADPLTFGEAMTPELQAAIPVIVEQILDEAFGHGALRSSPAVAPAITAPGLL
jgi:hydrogenase maturation protease